MGTKAQPTAPTPENILFGEGAFYFNFGETDEAVVGAVNGGGVEFVDMTWREPEFTGKRGPVQGLKKVQSVTPVIRFNSVEIANSTNLTKFFSYLDITNSATAATDGKEVIEFTLNPDATKYLKNVTFVGEDYEGKDVVISVLNALGDGALNLALENNADVVPEVTFTGHYTSTDLKAVPFKMERFTA